MSPREDKEQAMPFTTAKKPTRDRQQLLAVPFTLGQPLPLELTAPTEAIFLSPSCQPYHNRPYHSRSTAPLPIPTTKQGWRVITSAPTITTVTSQFFSEAQPCVPASEARRKTS